VCGVRTSATDSGYSRILFLFQYTSYVNGYPYLVYLSPFKIIFLEENQNKSFSAVIVYRLADQRFENVFPTSAAMLSFANAYQL
jgi:hypothetical protein